MKQLYLVRHAKAAKDYPELTDFERPLTPRGRMEAPVMGDELAQMKIHPDLIISSPANRAITTARFLADKLHYSKSNILILEEFYEPWPEDLLKLLQQIDDKFDKVMVVGHNPSVQIVAGIVSDFDHDNFPTCAVAGISLDIKSWEKLKAGKGALDFFIFPKKFRDAE